MKLVPRKFLLLFALAVLLAFQHERLAGALLDPYLEGVLTRLFGMEVRFETLRANLFTGHVTGTGVEFHNQPEFSDSPHLWIQKVEGTVDVKALFRRKVIIPRTDFYDLNFLIERRMFDAGKRTNIWTWIHHIRTRNDGKPKGPPGPQWTVNMPDMEIRGGRFVFDDLSDPVTEKRFVFDKLQGQLLGFSWPTANPAVLKQALNLKGVMGHEQPAPFEIHGHANFATKHVSFDLTGRAVKGKIAEYRRFWRDHPIDVRAGNFDLDIRMVCVRRNIRTHTLLKLYEFKVLPGVKPSEFFLGLPYTAALGFLQSQKVIHLRVPVVGRIQDPKFEFYKAFGQAFQQSLAAKIQGGIKTLTLTPVKLAEVVTGTQIKLTNGFEKITGMKARKEGES